MLLLTIGVRLQGVDDTVMLTQGVLKMTHAVKLKLAAAMAMCAHVVTLVILGTERALP
jgi:hypothetical protein